MGERPLCYVDQQGKMLQVSKDMMTTKCQQVYIFFPAVFMKAKKKKSQHILVSFEYTDWPKHRHSLYQSYCYKNCTLQTV